MTILRKLMVCVTIAKGALSCTLHKARSCRVSKIALSYASLARVPGEQHAISVLKFNLKYMQMTISTVFKLTKASGTEIPLFQLTALSCFV